MNPLKSTVMTALLLATAIAGAQGNETAPAQDPPATAVPADAPAAAALNGAFGTVIFFRPRKMMGAAVGFKVRENEIELGKLRNGTFFALKVAPGAHHYVVHS